MHINFFLAVAGHLAGHHVVCPAERPSEHHLIRTTSSRSKNARPARVCRGVRAGRDYVTRSPRRIGAALAAGACVLALVAVKTFGERSLTQELHIFGPGAHWLSESVPCISPRSADPDLALNPGYVKTAVAPGVAFTCPPDEEVTEVAGGEGVKQHMAFYLKGGGLTGEADALALSAAGGRSLVLPAPGGKRLNHYAHYEDMTRSMWERYVLTIADPLKLRCGHTVFEVGVGSGAFLAVLLRHFDIRGAGTDLSLPLVRLARRALPGTYCVVDGTKDTAAFVPPGAFDRVVAHSLFFFLHGEPAARAVFADMVRIVRPGGVVGVMSINRPAAEPGHGRHYGKAENGMAGFTQAFFRLLAREAKLCAPRFEGQPRKYHNFNGRYSVFVQKPPCTWVWG